jgi:hypothetical protein
MKDTYIVFLNDHIICCCTSDVMAQNIMNKIEGAYPGKYFLRIEKSFTLNVDEYKYILDLIMLHERLNN